MTDNSNSPWIHSRRFDLTWIIAPGLLSCFLAMIFFKQVNSIGFGLWFLLIVAIDVSHVYATLFRTYLNRSAKEVLKDLLWIIPFFAWAVSSMLYAYSPLSFWRVLAYAALFHFIRQQYGFLRLYQRNTKSTWIKQLESSTLYLSMIAPVIFWHTHLPRSFEWFVPGDFVSIQLPWLTKFSYGLFGLSTMSLLIAYARKKFRIASAPFLVIVSTAFSWNVGIALFNDDFAFTVTNVLAHGIPYFALIWIQGKKSPEQYSAKINRMFFENLTSIFIFALFLIFLASVEEGFWELLIQQEGRKTFSTAFSTVAFASYELQALVVALLATPQLTHYLIDGIIWRRSFSTSLGKASNYSLDDHREEFCKTT